MSTYDYTKSIDLPLFDRAISQQRKREGMAKAAAANPHLPLAREIAERIARERGTVTADCVMRELGTKHGILPAELGQASGSIFVSSKFEKTGAWRPSDRASNNGRENRVWRLK